MSAKPTSRQASRNEIRKVLKHNITHNITQVLICILGILLRQKMTGSPSQEGSCLQPWDVLELDGDFKRVLLVISIYYPQLLQMEIHSRSREIQTSHTGPSQDYSGR